jgi:diguanylate cyclase (GGDEF)-like protein
MTHYEQVAHKDATRLAAATATDGDGRERSMGRIGGMLLCVGATLAFASTMLLDPRPAAWVFGLIALAFAAGVWSLAVDWERLPQAADHIPPLVATVLVGAVDIGTQPGAGFYSWLYVLVVVMVAYSFKSRVVVGAYLGLVSLCSAAPLLDPDVSAGALGRELIISLPSLVIAGALVVYFRERLESGRAAYEKLARIDPLTGVGNYRTLHERLGYEISRHERHGRRLAVMLLDLNRFKHVNESYGHLEGDRLLRDVGRVLQSTVRDEDTVARQGGDEFSVLAPETTTVEVMALARRIAVALEEIPVGGERLSASIGWAIYPDHGESAEHLLRCADDALRAGKARWIPEGSQSYWPEHLRRLRDAPGGAARESGGATAS